MGPIDYTLQVQQPLQAALTGYQTGAAVRQDQFQQQQQQLALQTAQRRQEVLAGLASKTNATADDYATAMTQLPDIAEHLQKAWTVKNSAQQQSAATELLETGAAIKSGKPQVAADRLVARADAIEAGGQPTPESQALRTQAQLITDHPEFALGQIQAMLAANPLGKDAAETLSKFGTERRADQLQPDLVRKGASDADKAGSDATTAAVGAKFAEQNAVQDLAKKGWDIKKITADIEIAREANRIAAMNAASTRETNSLRRQELELKVKEHRAALDEKIRDRVATVESAASTIDNFLNTADRILTAGVGTDGKPNSTLRAATGPIDSRLPTMQTDVANIEALVETLGSQAFLSQIPALKGMGQLSDAEGKKVQAALTNLSLSQGADQLVANVKEAQRLILKARKNLETRHGVPAGVPDTPAVQTPAPDIDALVKKYGG